jgi:signal transduction histidine kinase
MGIPSSPATLNWRHSIKTKFVALIILLIGAISVFIYAFSPTWQEKEAMKAVAAQAESLAEVAAFIIGPALFFADMATIEEALDGVQQNADLVYIRVLDDGGERVAGRTKEGGWREGDSFASDGSPLYEVERPILHDGQQTGRLDLGLSLGKVKKGIRQSRQAIAVVSIVIFIVGVAAVLGTGTVVTRPLSRIAGTVEQIARGDLSQRVPVTAADEVGRLAASFNAMVDSLETAQAQLREANQFLEERVAARTRELQREIEERTRAEDHRNRLEEQLRQAQKMQAVGQLTAGIAHNFNNLLQIIMGHTQLVLTDLDKEAEADLREVELACQRAKAMIEQLMVFGRSVPTVRRPFSLCAAVDHVWGICRTTFDRRIALEVAAPADLPAVLGDVTQVEQVVLNLCINSRDAVEAEDREGYLPRIDLSVEVICCDPPEGLVLPRPAAGRHARIRVADNGTGMDEETQKHLFEPFFTTKEVGKGTGLGLSTAYAIVQRHGGWLEVASEVGRGTVFEVYLPIAEQADAADAGAATGDMPRGTEVILLIDDEAAVRRLLCSTLEKFGYTVVQGADGEEGLEVFQRERHRLDLVLLDLSMPGMPGREVLAALRTAEPGLKVVLCTGHTEGSAEKLQAEAVLYKPFALTQLMQTVRRVLDV